MLVARLRACNGSEALSDDTIRQMLLAGTDDAAQAIGIRATGTRLVPSDLAEEYSREKSRKPIEPAKVGAIGKQPKNPRGGMTLRAYVGLGEGGTWEKHREQRASTWERESWWWDRHILPALGDVRLVDLDAEKWTAFINGLTCGGRSKALCQTAYRTALRHAAEVLE